MLTRCCSPPEKVAGGSDHSLARDAEHAQQELGPRARLVGAHPEADRRLGHDVDRGDARDHAQELADEAQGAAADVEHRPGLGTHQLDPVGAVADADRPRIGPVVAVERAQQGALAGARGTDQRQAFARRDGKRHVAQHGQRQIALGMHDEGFGEAGDAERGLHRHTGRIEATSIWV